MRTTRHLLTALAALTLSAGATIAMAAPSDAQARYAQERAACMNGQSHQDRATCMQEAVNARAAAMRGQLDVANADYRRNALERCKAFTGEDARECRARVEGAGTISGSVEDGGILRELVTIEPAPQ